VTLLVENWRTRRQLDVFEKPISQCEEKARRFEAGRIQGIMCCGCGSGGRLCHHACAASTSTNVAREKHTDHAILVPLSYFERSQKNLANCMTRTAKKAERSLDCVHLDSGASVCAIERLDLATISHFQP
jgi:hypothetical protein